MEFSCTGGGAGGGENVLFTPSAIRTFQKPDFPGPSPVSGTLSLVLLAATV